MKHAAVLSLVLLAGCNTLQGAKQDLSRIGASPSPRTAVFAPVPTTDRERARDIVRQCVDDFDDHPDNARDVASGLVPDVSCYCAEKKEAEGEIAPFLVKQFCRTRPVSVVSREMDCPASAQRSCPEQEHPMDVLRTHCVAPPVTRPGKDGIPRYRCLVEWEEWP